MRERRSPNEQRNAQVSDLCTVAEAAEMLGVSVSTIWRWVDSGQLPAFRVGPKAIRIKRQDVEAAIQPVSRQNEVPTMSRIYTDTREALRPRTAEERARALAWLERAEKLAKRFSARRKGLPLPDSAAIIREAREERSKQL
ncbi:MAG: helix-turn-helix domain-containing protein [Dehalococcoidia bacterium]